MACSRTVSVASFGKAVRDFPLVVLGAGPVLGAFLVLGACLALVACDSGQVSTPHAAPAQGRLVAADTVGKDVAGLSEAEAAFVRDVLPVLTDACASCHGTGRSAPAWFGDGDDMYARIKGWTTARSGALVVPEDPNASPLLSYGAHTGPAYPETGLAAARAWLVRETATASTASDVLLAPLVPQAAPAENSIDLSPHGVAGGRLRFVFEPGAPGTAVATVRALALHAGAVGFSAAAPRMLLCTPAGDCRVDPANRIFVETLSVPAGGQVALGGDGLVVLADFPEGSALSFAFGSLQETP